MKLSFLLLALLGPLATCHADAVRLQINGPDGKPVGGAKVRFVEAKMQGDNLVVTDSTSDANGIVVVESRNPIFADPREDSQSLMVARVLAPGLAASVFQLKGGDNSFSLAAGRVLEGVALDATDKPVATVGLLITSLPFTSMGVDTGQAPGAAVRMPDELALKTTTDEQGRWKFESLPLSGKVDIEARDARFKRENFSLDVAQPNPSLHLTQGSTIKGRLLKPNGTAAAGIKITPNSISSEIITDAQGRFEITGV
ncbi:hypothetical protein EON80_28755, partial [bacterium]